MSPSTIAVCKTDAATDSTTINSRSTTDLSRALIDGSFDHIGEIKGADLPLA